MCPCLGHTYKHPHMLQRSCLSSRRCRDPRAAPLRNDWQKIAPCFNPPITQAVGDAWGGAGVAAAQAGAAAAAAKAEAEAKRARENQARASKGGTNPIPVTG